MADKSKRLFGTGKIRYGAPGATLTDANNVLDVQNVSVDIDFAEQIVRLSKQLSVDVVASTRYDRTIKISFETKSFEPGLIPYATGATVTSSGGNDVYTFGDTDDPDPIQIVFVGKTEDGKTVEFDLPIGICKSFPIDMKREDYTGTKIEVEYRPDANLTTNKPQLKVQQ